MVLFTVFFPASFFLAWRLKLIKSLALETGRTGCRFYRHDVFLFLGKLCVQKPAPIFRQSPLISYLEPFWPSAAPGCARFFYKVSLHAVAMGGLISFFILFAFQDIYVSGLYIVVPVLIAGSWAPRALSSVP